MTASAIRVRPFLNEPTLLTLLLPALSRYKNIPLLSRTHSLQRGVAGSCRLGYVFVIQFTESGVHPFIYYLSRYTIVDDSCRES